MGPIQKPFTFAYLLRAPLGLWLALAVFVPAATRISLFRGLFVFEDWKEVFWTSAIVFLAAASMMIVTNLVLLYGEHRLYGSGPPPLPVQNDLRTVVVFLIALAPALFFIYEADSYSLAQSEFVKKPTPLAGWQVYGASALGLLAAAITVLAAKLFGMWLAQPCPGLEKELHFVFPINRVPWLGKWLRRLNMRDPLHGLRCWLMGFVQSFPKRIGKLADSAGHGYYGLTGSPPQRVFLPGHLFAAWLMFLVFVSYVISGASYQGEYSSPSPMPEAATFPTIFHVLIALLLAIWCFSGLAFFLDRYHVPVISIVTVILGCSIIFGDTDHVFDLAPGRSVRLPTPKEALRKRPGDPIIVVAAAGGGIHAAAWTAKVLGNLLIENRGFPPAVRVISSVSGGSVGALHYLTTYPAACAGAVSPAEAIGNARKDSLEGIAWGLLHPDLRRALFPWALPPNVDRGWALEKILAKRSATTCLHLSQLSEAVDAGVPAMLINSTAVETGAPMVFASTKFPPPEAAAGIDNFHRRYGDGADIGLATAVRLSATFPYVSPAARASHGALSLHFVDGGYYDNYGMVTLLAWLRAALRRDSNSAPSEQASEPLDADFEKRQILILQIDSFPPPGDPQADQQPWLFQLTAPVLALYDARSQGQQMRDQLEYSLQTQTHLFDNVKTTQFRYQPRHCECQGDPPLSWHLTRRESQCIDYAWDDINQRESKECVKAFLAGKAEAIQTYCKAPTQI